MGNGPGGLSNTIQAHGVVKTFTTRTETVCYLTSNQAMSSHEQLAQLPAA